MMDAAAEMLRQEAAAKAAQGAGSSINGIQRLRAAAASATKVGPTSLPLRHGLFQRFLKPSQSSHSMSLRSQYSVPLLQPPTPVAVPVPSAPAVPYPQPLVATANPPGMFSPESSNEALVRANTLFNASFLRSDTKAPLALAAQLSSVNAFFSPARSGSLGGGGAPGTGGRDHLLSSRAPGTPKSALKRRVSMFGAQDPSAASMASSAAKDCAAALAEASVEGIIAACVAGNGAIPRALPTPVRNAVMLRRVSFGADRICPIPNRHEIAAAAAAPSPQRVQPEVAIATAPAAAPVAAAAPVVRQLDMDQPVSEPTMAAAAPPASSKPGRPAGGPPPVAGPRPPVPAGGQPRAPPQPPKAPAATPAATSSSSSGMPGGLQDALLARAREIGERRTAQSTAGDRAPAGASSSSGSGNPLMDEIRRKRRQSYSQFTVEAVAPAAKPAAATASTHKQIKTASSVSMAEPARPSMMGLLKAAIESRRKSIGSGDAPAAPAPAAAASAPKPSARKARVAPPTARPVPPSAASASSVETTLAAVRQALGQPLLEGIRARAAQMAEARAARGAATEAPQAVIAVPPPESAAASATSLSGKKRRRSTGDAAAGPAAGAVEGEERNDGYSGDSEEGGVRSHSESSVLSADDVELGIIAGHNLRCSPSRSPGSRVTMAATASASKSSSAEAASPSASPAVEDSGTEAAGAPRRRSLLSQFAGKLFDSASKVYDFMYGVDAAAETDTEDGTAAAPAAKSRKTGQSPGGAASSAVLPAISEEGDSEEESRPPSGGAGAVAPPPQQAAPRRASLSSSLASPTSASSRPLALSPLSAGVGPAGGASRRSSLGPTGRASDPASPTRQVQMARAMLQELSLQHSDTPNTRDGASLGGSASGSSDLGALIAGATLSAVDAVEAEVFTALNEELDPGTADGEAPPSQLPPMPSPSSLPDASLSASGLLSSSLAPSGRRRSSRRVSASVGDSSFDAAPTRGTPVAEGAVAAAGASSHALVGGVGDISSGSAMDVDEDGGAPGGAAGARTTVWDGHGDEYQRGLQSVIYENGADRLSTVYEGDSDEEAEREALVLGELDASRASTAASARSLSRRRRSSVVSLGAAAGDAGANGRRNSGAAGDAPAVGGRKRRQTATPKRGRASLESVAPDEGTPAAVAVASEDEGAAGGSVRKTGSSRRRASAAAHSSPQSAAPSAPLVSSAAPGSPAGGIATAKRGRASRGASAAEVVSAPEAESAPAETRLAKRSRSLSADGCGVGAVDLPPASSAKRNRKSHPVTAPATPTAAVDTTAATDDEADASYSSAMGSSAAGIIGMKVTDLKAALSARGLDASGTKAVLVERLQAAVASAAAGQAPSHAVHATEGTPGGAAAARSPVVPPHNSSASSSRTTSRRSKA